MAVSVEQSIRSASRVFSQRLIACEAIPHEKITDRLNLTRAGNPVEGISRPLLSSVRKSQWFSIDDGRIFIELRKPEIISRDFSKKLKSIKGVDFDDCMASATKWHRKEQELMEEFFGIPREIGKGIYEMSKVMVPGKVVGEKRYTPKLNLSLLTTFVDMKEYGSSEEKALDEVADWREAVNDLIQTKGEATVDRLSVDPRIRDIFLKNNISKYLYRDFVGAVFDSDDQTSLKFIATRGKIEGPLGQVYKVHTSGAMNKKRDVHMAIYTNDIKAETLIQIGRLLPDKIKNSVFYLFDDNTDEMVPYLKTAQEQGLDKIWVVQVAHPDAKRKDHRIDLQPERVIGRENGKETVLRYYSIKPDLHLTRHILFPN